MDAGEQIKKFIDFFDSNYKDELIKGIRKEQKRLMIDFSQLAKFEPELAELLLEDPENTIKAAEIAIENFDVLGDVKGFRARFKNLPESQKMLVRNIRSKHIGKLLCIDGIVRQKSDVRPQMVSARFECPSCGAIINVLQLDKKYTEPTRCSCGRKGKFKLLSKELIDAQGLVLEEVPEDLEGGEQPKRVNVLLKDDLVSPMTEKHTNPGIKIRLSGIVKEVPIMGKDGGKLTRFDLIIECNYIEAVHEDYMDIEISEEEEKEIRDLATDPKGYRKIVNSIAPSIYGYELVKEALMLQLVGGVRKERSDGVVTRGDIHILLIGDPGSGKSQMLKRIIKISPKARYVSGKGVTGAGITASVVRDEFLMGWALEAGALVLANRGLCAIDELDKMSPEDRAAMHEALEQQTISISKANIQATLRAETTVLAAANPKFGRFDPYGSLAEQINLPPTLINRFDLIFPIKDLPDPTKDDKMAKHILGLHQNPNMNEPEIETQLLKKFLAYAKRNSHPKLSESAIEEIRRYYVEMRNPGNQDEGGIKSIPISARQLEALVRMSEAIAKIRLADTVTKKDAKRAVELLHFCLREVGLDPETGQIDIDRIATGISASQRSHMVNIKEIISELENRLGKTIPIEDVVREAVDRGINEEIVEETIEKLKRSGDLFEPRRGFIARI